MDILDRAQMCAVWEILPIRTRITIANAAAPDWTETFRNEKAMALHLNGGWFYVPKRVRQLITFYLQARATILEHDEWARHHK